jgi:predicted ATPase/class 3 adenylate cyclase
VCDPSGSARPGSARPGSDLRAAIYGPAIDGLAMDGLAIDGLERASVYAPEMQMQVCPNCGEENPAKFRLCGYCGTPLAQALPPQELRKTVTIIFSDLKGSTALGEMIDPEALHEIKNRYFGVMADVLAHHGGKIEKYIGDAIMAVFGLPKVREDDALRAVRAALGMQEALHRINLDFERAYGITLAARMGVNTGEVVATADPNADQRLADGDAVNVAARLEQASPAMEVYIGDLTYQLVRDLVEVEPVEPLTLKGKSEPVPAYRLMAVRAETAPATAARSPLVGRDAEVALLGNAFDQSTAGRRARLVTVIGDAGVGKSRLIADFVASVADRATVLRGRCLPYGDGITFWPIVDVTRQAAAISDEDPPELAREKLSGLLDPGFPEHDEIVTRVCSAVGLSTDSYPVSELFWGIRKLFEGLAAERPLVVVVDDIHSAEATFLELLEHLVDSAEQPVVLLCSARHELLDHHAEWGEREGTERIVLRPLSEADTETMIDRLLGRSGLAPGLRARVGRAAEGNPLFVEQMVSMLVDREMIRADGDQWVAAGDLSELTIPPSIQALLAARLDHLNREERAVIEPASVIGLIFPEPAIEELVPDTLRTGVSAQLGVLDRKQFVHPQPTGDDFYRFHHLLIRDAAYNSLLKRSRAQLHEKFAIWAERVNRERDRETEFEEILGYHLEQAYRYRLDLGPLDDEGRRIGEKAAERLSDAGARALARGDAPAASNLLARAAALLPEHHALRLKVLPQLAEALVEAGDLDQALVVVADAQAAAAAADDQTLGALARLEHLAVEFYRSEGGNVDDAVGDARKLLEVFDRAGDHGGMARGWRFLTLAYGTAGMLAEASQAAEQYGRHASLAGDDRLAARGASAFATVALHGPTPVTEVIETCSELLGNVSADRTSQAVILLVLGVLHAMDGQFDRGRELCDRARATLRELGRSVTAQSTSIEASRVEMLAGEPGAAERLLRADFDALEATGEKYFRSTIAGQLAQALYAQDRLDESDRLATIAEQLSAEDDIWSQALWRGVRAKLLARGGHAGDAIAMLAEADRRVVESDDIEVVADLRADAAEVARVLDGPESAGPPLREALELYERKGDRVAADRTRRLIVGGRQATRPDPIEVPT